MYYSCILFQSHTSSKLSILFTDMASKYMSYEDTVLHLNSGYFKGYKFYSTTDIDSLIKQIPDDPYGGDQIQPEQPPERGEKLSPQQKGKLPKNCQIFYTADKSKASNIEKIISEHFCRDIVTTSTPDQVHVYLKQLRTYLVRKQRFHG